MAMVVQQDVLRFAVPIDDSLLVEMLKAEQNFSRIEAGPRQLEARVAAHVVDVKLQVSTWRYLKSQLKPKISDILHLPFIIVSTRQSASLVS
jgi:hypothetical protein